MNSNLEYYRPFGNQSYLRVKFPVKPVAATLNITTPAGTTRYVYNTDFFGDSPAAVAKSLAATINSDVSHRDIAPTAENPVRDVFAVYFGDTVAIIACAPGDVGNSFTIALEDSEEDETDPTFPNGTTFIGGYDALTPTRVLRQAPSLYRSVEAADLLPVPDIAIAPTNTGGTLDTGTTYNVRVIFGTAYGRTTPSTISSTTGDTTVAIGINGSPDYIEYLDIFCSSDAEPTYAGRVTWAQFGAGVALDNGAIIEGTGIPGVQIYSIFTSSAVATAAVQNTAYTVPSLDSAKNVNKYQYVELDVKLAATVNVDLNSPLIILPAFLDNDTEGARFYLGEPVTINFGGATAGHYQSQLQRIRIETRGAKYFQAVVAAMPSGAVITLTTSAS